MRMRSPGWYRVSMSWLGQSAGLQEMAMGEMARRSACVMVRGQRSARRVASSVFSAGRAGAVFCWGAGVPVWCWRGCCCVMGWRACSSARRARRKVRMNSVRAASHEAWKQCSRGVESGVSAR